MIVEWHLLEPTGSSAPRFPSESSSSTLKKPSSISINLLCPAQAYPAPLFRWITLSRMLGERQNRRPNQFCMTFHQLNPRCRRVFHNIEPTSSSAPRFASESYIGFQLRKSSGMAINLLCPAQAFPAPLFRWITFLWYSRHRVDRTIFCALHFVSALQFNWASYCVCTEPTSSSAPRFASESYGFVLRKSSAMAFNLLCPAQAFPAPLFR